MKSPDSPPERSSRSYSGSDEPGPAHSDERLDRGYDDPYSEYSPRTKRRSGVRNLLLGVLLIAIAGAVFIKAIMLTGAKAGPPLAAALVTLLALFVLARARVLNQRNGGFVALGVVLLLAAILPLLEHTVTRVPVQGQAAVQPAAAPPPAASESPSAPAEPELPLLSSAFPLAAGSDQDQRFKVLRDLRVEMGDGKAYMIKEGEVLPVAGTAPGEVHFLAGDQKIALPLDTVEMLPPAAGAPAGGVLPGIPPQPATAGAGAVPPTERAERPAQITERAQKEAIRRYPALGQIDSPENKLFRETFQEMKNSGANDFFADPQWPLQLAELLARREKWQRQP